MACRSQPHSPGPCLPPRLTRQESLALTLLTRCGQPFFPVSASQIHRGEPTSEATYAVRSGHQGKGPPLRRRRPQGARCSIYTLAECTTLHRATHRCDCPHRASLRLSAAIFGLVALTLYPSTSSVPTVHRPKVRQVSQIIASGTQPVQVCPAHVLRSQCMATVISRPRMSAGQRIDSRSGRSRLTLPATH